MIRLTIAVVVTFAVGLAVKERWGSPWDIPAALVTAFVVGAVMAIPEFLQKREEQQEMLFHNALLEAEEEREAKRERRRLRRERRCKKSPSEP